MTHHITDEQIDEALREIDSIAREFDHYEYGLPIGDIDDGKPNAKMRDAIRALLALAAPQAVPMTLAEVSEAHHGITAPAGGEKQA